ncbi:fasciclin domain-containing protein [Hymenobacter nitidus]|uniref:fasciclin domain-containing protein n=1 Tax=Hymenobacter nitidus TaxID=2880929 RepID=UPI0021D3F31E|nr:fasciclin domain-containing protein [Hymenobacter nitidus]
MLIGLLSAMGSGPATAQQAPKTKTDAQKTKTRQAGRTTKSKVADDGKVKQKDKVRNVGKQKVKVKPTPTGPPPGAGVLVGGTLMTPDKDIVNNAVNSTDHTTLVSALAAAGLVETLKGAGPYTVFAPTNAAFDKLPAGAVTTLMIPENKQKLRALLTYHVVPGRLSAADLLDGQALTTLTGETLTVVRKDDAVLLRDAKGSLALVLIPNIMSSNGVTHVVDAVLAPAK